MKCSGTHKDFIFYGYPYRDKSVCILCNKEHKIEIPLKNRILGYLALSGIPMTFAIIILGTKIFWCLWLSDNNCWSHFP